MSLLLFYTDPGTTTPYFLSHDHDPLTGLRHWIDTPEAAERYDASKGPSEVSRLEQDQALYGGQRISELNLGRLGFGMADPGGTGLEK